MKFATRKVFAFIMVFTLLTLTACSENEAPSSSTTPPPSSSDETTGQSSPEISVSSEAAPSSSTSSSVPSSSAPESSVAASEPEVSNSATASEDEIQNEGVIAFELSSGEGTSITESSSFIAENGDVLILEITSTITGGSVDLFLFSPDKKEQRISIENTTETQNISLSEGEWAYNCTGFFDRGSIEIVGTIA